MARVTAASVAAFYAEGFRNMRLGRRLWLLIALKLLIMFGVMKFFFFPDVLHERLSNDRTRSDFVAERLLSIDKE